MLHEPIEKNNLRTLISCHRAHIFVVNFTLVTYWINLRSHRKCRKTIQLRLFLVWVTTTVRVEWIEIDFEFWSIKSMENSGKSRAVFSRVFNFSTCHIDFLTLLRFSAILGRTRRGNLSQFSVFFSRIKSSVNSIKSLLTFHPFRNLFSAIQWKCFGQLCEFSVFHLSLIRKIHWSGEGRLWVAVWVEIWGVN